MGKPLYDEDFFEWTVTNAALLRAGRFEEADIDHIAEEIEDMGKSERHQLVSRLKVLLLHLLKWKYQPEKRGSSWERTILIQRDSIDDLLKEMPSLKAQVEDVLPNVYCKAVRFAAIETELPASAFPASCPFTLEQILDAEFYPQ